MAKKKNKKGTLRINMDGVETGGKTLPEGSYVVKVESVELKESTSGSEYLAFTFEVVEGKHKKAKLFHNCSLQPQALFNLKSVLIALQYEMESVEFDLDLDDLLDLECEVEVTHEMYEGKKKARIVEFSMLEDDDDEDEEDLDEDDDSDEDEEEDDEEDEDEDDEEDLSELSLKDLKAKAKEMGIKVKKGMSKDDIIELIEESMDDEDDEEEEDEEEDEIDYEELSLKELKALAKERGIKVKKGMDEDDIIELLEDNE